MLVCTDFWSTNNDKTLVHNMFQSVANVARVSMDLSTLGESTSYRLEQHLTNASVKSRWDYSSNTMETESIVSATENLVLIKVTAREAGAPANLL